MKVITTATMLNLYVNKPQIYKPQNKTLFMNPHELNALRIYAEKLEVENAKMRQLSTRKGFYSCFFAELKTAKTNKEAFDNVNELYESLFGEPRYSDYNSFKKMSHYYNQKAK